MGLFSKKEEVKKEATQQGEVKTVYEERVEREDPAVSERRLWSLNNIFLAIFLGILSVIIELLAVGFFNFDRESALILGLIIITIYAVVLFFLLEPVLLREVRHKEIKHIEKPVIKEVIRTIEKPIYKIIEKPIVKTIEKPIYKTIEKIKTVEKPVIKKVTKEVPVYIKPKIPQGHRYKYVASTTTKIYHLSSSRLARLIRPKNRIYSDSTSDLEKKGFKPSEHIKKELEEDARKHAKRMGKKPEKKHEKKIPKKTTSKGRKVIGKRV
jgi:hypothetical protein